jgi:uncharacterized protein with HEPN domain
MTDLNNKKIRVNIRNAYDMIPGGQQAQVRKELAEAKGIDQSNVWRIINGLTPLNVAERKEFELIFNKYGIDVWTGKSLAEIQEV